MKIMPDKIASITGYCTSGALFCWGSVFRWLHDLDWNLIAVISGVVIGIATFAVNLYFKRQILKSYRDAIARGIIAPPSQDE